jgi:isopropylmalate/homocitrate/citramalate synthase
VNNMLIYDTTLRDGEQMPGVVFSRGEKIELAKKFDDFGVDIIGLMPAVSEGERKVAEDLVDYGLRDKLIAATMMRKDHIDLAYDLGMKNIILFSSVSDIHLKKKLNISREENLNKAVRYINYAKEKGGRVFFAGEDSSRADFSYLVNFMNTLDVGYFLVCDTLGVLTPFQTYNWIKNLKKETDCKIGLHVHNDFGCATANSLAGMEAGADLVSGTFTGIGERAGNACLEEILVSLKCQYDVDLGVRYDLLGEICDLVQEYSGIELQKHKAIVGKNAFSHESGIHVDGVLKYSKNYEVIDPEFVGREREIIFGKHLGMAGLRYLFEGKFSEEKCREILFGIKELSQKEKRIFSENEVLKIFGD